MSQREVKTPVMVISYGTIGPDNQRLFAIPDDAGHSIMPLFTKVETAEIFRQHYNKVLMEQTLPMSITGQLGADSVDVMPEQLALCVVQNTKQLNDMLMLVHVKAGFIYLSVDPEPGKPLLCFEMDELSFSDGDNAV